MAKLRKFSTEFKARIALVALHGDRNMLASEYPNRVTSHCPTSLPRPMMF